VFVCLSADLLSDIQANKQNNNEKHIISVTEATNRIRTTYTTCNVIEINVIAQAANTDSKITNETVEVTISL